jgi:hypothetical protein
MSTFVQKHKYHLTIFAVLILTTLISGGYLLATDENARGNEIINNRESLSAKNKITSDNNMEGSFTSAQVFIQDDINVNHIKKDDTILEKSNTQSLPTSSTKARMKQCTNDCTDIQIKTPEKTYDLRLTTSTSLYNAMKTLQKNNDFTFNGVSYSSLGFFVNEINGTKNSAWRGLYWIYYINGQSAMVGVSNYIVKQNDIIEWKYEKNY